MWKVIAELRLCITQWVERGAILKKERKNLLKTWPLFDTANSIIF